MLTPEQYFDLPLESLRHLAGWLAGFVHLRRLESGRYPSALVVEISNNNEPLYADAEVCWAMGHAPPEVCDLLRKMPAQAEGKTGWTD